MGNLIASHANRPPGLHSHYGVPFAHSSCVDASGNYWIYGGISSGWAGQNSLWRFNEATGWAQMSGNSNPYNSFVDYAPVYGSLGIEGASVAPGNRYSAMMFCGKDGKIYLFGGKRRLGFSASNETYNSMFSFNPSTLRWTWIGGTQSNNATGTFGSKGVANSANVPSARESGGACMDTAGNFWVFGGSGFDSTGTFGALSDLWKYDGNNWTWMAGTNVANTTANWGTKGVLSATNTPGGRQTPLFCGPTVNKLRLAGGYAYLNSAYALLYPGLPNGLQDVWEFDKNSNQWVWLHGHNSTTAELPLTLGTVGKPDVNNIPTGGFYPSWMDTDGTLWLYGFWGNSYLMKWK